jgi:hypothetical protein
MNIIFLFRIKEKQTFGRWLCFSPRPGLERGTIHEVPCSYPMMEGEAASETVFLPKMKE